MSSEFQTWLAREGLSDKADASRQGPEAIFVADVSGRLAEDGWIEPSAWKQAAPTPMVFLDGTGDTPQAPTAFRLLTAGGVLFLRFECKDPDAAHLVYACTGRDSDRLWRDDCVEVLLRPGARTGRPAAHFIMNPAGGLYDAATDARGRADPSWDPPTRRRARILPDGWTAELAVPLRALVPKGEVPLVWRGNLCRVRQGRAGAFAEDTAWRATGSLRAGVPEHFGRLYLQAVEKSLEAPAAERFDRGRANPLQRYKDPQTICRILEARYELPAAVAATDRGDDPFGPGSTMLFRPTGGSPGDDLQFTRAAVVRRGGELVVHVECSERDVKSVAPPSPLANIWQDDCVEIFLALERKESSDYLQVIVNAAGTAQAHRGKRGAAVRGLKAEVKIGADAWRVRAAVPLAWFGIGEGEVPALWGLNVVRHRRQRRGEPEQYSAWSPFPWSAHDPTRFGTLWLPDADVFADLGSPEEIAAAAKAQPAPAPAAAEAPAAVVRFDWDVFGAEEAQRLALTGMVGRHLAGIRDAQYALRDRDWAKIRTWADWQKTRERIRADFWRSVGEPPRKDCPLKPRLATACDGPDVRIENLIYQSRPGLYVTANVFVPKRRGRRKLPTVLRVVGHSTAGRLGGGVVSQCIDLARSGYFVLSVDTLGQGERIYTANGYGSTTPTRNHYAMGAPCTLTASNIAGYMIHDVIRGLDYLQTRPEVDPKRIVVTGSSGGGTLTSYVCALDDRPCAAAPVSAVGSTRTAGGNYDSEQVLYGTFAYAIDSEGRCALTAPRPLCIICEVSGKAQEQRNRQAYESVRRIYALKGAEERFEYHPTPGPHGYGSGHYRRFRNWLKRTVPPNPDHPAPQGPAPRVAREELYASRSGRVFFSRDLPQAETVFTLNARRIARPLGADRAVASERQLRRRAQQVREVLRELLVLPDGKFEPVKVDSRGRSKLLGLAVEKLLLETQPGVLVPAVFFPAGSKSPAVVWLSGRGKRALLRRRWGQVEAVVKAGVSVLVPDVRGVGETAAGEDLSFLGEETSLNGFSYQAAAPLIGMRVRDALCCAGYLRSRSDVDAGRVGLVGDSLSPCNPPKIRQLRLLVDPGIEPLHRADSLGPAVALLALALDDALACCATRGALASYASLCRESHFCHPLSSFVPGILRHCDVADVCAAAAPRPLLLLGSVNGLNQRLDAVGDGQPFAAAVRAYRLAGAPDRLGVDHAGGGEEIGRFLRKSLAEPER